MKTILFSLLLLIVASTSCSSDNKITVFSPSKNIRLEINNSKKNHEPCFELISGSEAKILSGTFHLNLKDIYLNNDLRVIGSETESVSNTWINKFGERSEIPDNYNQLKIFLKNKEIRINLIFRVYDEGAAFAYEFPRQDSPDSLIITDEKILFTFSEDHYAWSASRAQASYSHVPLSKIDIGAERPLVVEIDSNLTIALTEAKLVDFARMKFEPDSTGGIAIRTRLGSKVKKSLPFQSPWRVIMIGENAGDLLEKNYLISNLNDPSEIRDDSWITPGKVLREVSLSTAGGKAAVDFVSEHNMQYVEYDAGWYGPENSDESDPVNPVLDPARSKGPLDLHEVIRYAGSKNIKVLLYVNRRALERKLDEILPVFREWGVSGIKFGFVQVGTQEVTAWMHNAIKKCADYKMVVNVHDEYRPTGFSRTYPNFLTQEGIRGDEESPTNTHTLITMFTRMLAGAGDNTICYYDNRVDEKMGSHASQLAKAVCIFSPLQFLYWYDKPVSSPGKKTELWGKPNILGDEPELEFFDNVPTVWDETRVLYASIGEYGVIARRSGNEWFIGGINGDEKRTLDIKFSFLDPGIKYRAAVYSDDPSVNTRTHVRIDRIGINRETVFPAVLDPNKGFAMHIVPQ